VHGVEGETHSPRRVDNPAGWMFLLSHSQPTRLVVFVHGFRGRPVKTWRNFDASGGIGSWWRDSDLLFVGYESTRENISGVAAKLRTELPTLYPGLPARFLREGDGILRELGDDYRELVLVGHSLGGVVLRRALADSAQEWLDMRKHSADVPKPALLRASVRLFSPASAGFRAAGFLGLLRACPGWFGVDMYLRRSSAFEDLQPSSEFLKATRERTERLVSLDSSVFASLRPRIVWANPDNVVLAERYDTDSVEEFAHGRSHVDVCKPDDAYRLPWSFVEHGKCP